MIKTPTPEFLFSAPPHFVLAKLLRFQRTFHEKSFVSGFGADSPNIQYAQKKHGAAVLFYLSKRFGTAFQTLLQGAFCKNPLENPQKLSFTNNNSNKNTIKDKIYIDFSENI